MSPRLERVPRPTVRVRADLTFLANAATFLTTLVLWTVGALLVFRGVTC